jgi:hypothetical protein
MSVKHIGLMGLVVALCGLGGAHAQAPTPPPDGSEVLPQYTPNSTDGPSPYAPSGPSAPASPSGAGAGTFSPSPGVAPPDQQAPVILGLPSSPWLVYPSSPCCCGAVGTCGGPIGSELFVRSGMTFPLGGGFFGAHLNPGWAVEGGGRLLFFNPAVNKACTASLSVSNFLNYESHPNPVATLFNFPVRTTVNTAAGPVPAVLPVSQVSASIGMFNQTFANFGLGREWYILGSGDPGQQTGGWIWRVGADAGGRYGTALVRFEDTLSHHTDVVGGMYGALHTDAEHPWRCGLFQLGIRLEYNYIWNDILQSQNYSDFQSINLLFQAGVRF